MSTETKVEEPLFLPAASPTPVVGLKCRDCQQPSKKLIYGICGRCLHKRAGKNRERGKYAVHAFADSLRKRGWMSRSIPSSGAGQASALNIFADAEATFEPDGIYLAAEVKSSIRGVVYLERPVQIYKLFQSLNIFRRYPKRYAVLVAHFRKQWRYMILRSYQASLNFIMIKPADKYPRTRGNKKADKRELFTKIDDLIRFMKEDKTISFSMSMPNLPDQPKE